MATNPQLPYQPQLPTVPQGVYTDPTYASGEAQLRANTIAKYHDYLAQLGYTDAEGNYIPGSLDIEANRTRGDIGRGLDQAQLGVTRASQQQGTLFSGLRADRTADAQYGLRTQLSQLEEDLPRQFASAYEGAAGTLNDYTLQRNQLLADAALRYEPPAITGDAPGIPEVPAGVAPGTDIGVGAAPPRVVAPAKPLVKPSTLGGAGGLKWGGRTFIHPQNFVNYLRSRGSKIQNIQQFYKLHPGVKHFAEGGVVDQPTEAVVGDQGPEAMVPLDQGLQAAIQQLIQMYQQGGEQGGEGSPTEQDQGQQQQGQKAPANVHATGLKAAAKILMELAKQHEEEQGNNAPPQGTPMQPPPEEQPPPPPPEQQMLPPDASGLMGRS